MQHLLVVRNVCCCNLRKFLLETSGVLRSVQVLSKVKCLKLEKIMSKGKKSCNTTYQSGYGFFHIIVFYIAKTYRKSPTERLSTEICE